MHDGCSKYCARELETGKYTVPAWGLALDAVVCQMVSAAGDSGVKDANTLKQQARRHMLSVNQALKDKKLKPTQVAKHKTDAAAHAWWDKFGEDYDNGTMPDEFAELGVAAPRRSPRKVRCLCLIILNNTILIEICLTPCLSYFFSPCAGTRLSTLI